MNLPSPFPADPELVHSQAVSSLFALFESLCEGAIAVDSRARIAWINDKYRNLLGIGAADAVIGRDIESVLPHSRMREVAESGRPILLDIMQFGEKWFVVTRMPINDEAGVTIGAVGFVLYDRLNYLKPLVARFTELQSSLLRAERELAQHRRAKYSFSQFLGAHPRILEVKRQARRAAQLDTTVLLLGETGTGKELLAHAIHAASPRANRPFVGVNLAAVPETLLEADFFGVAPGAYTGADRRERDGKFKIADGGTLFLDEVGEMPLAVQAKLLRALQEQEIEPLGSNRLIKVDVRVIAATSRALKQLVDNGQFRADLYYRLNVLPITLPPLRERLSDIEILAEAFLERIQRAGGGTPREITASGVAALARHDWPGNVRELANTLERAVAVSDRPRLGAEDFARILPEPGPARPGSTGEAAALVRPLADAVRTAERETIRAALAATSGRKAGAAKLLGISRAKLY
ncbi:MAG: sigma 54-interacting transcriptional regulator, partial [Proteobacteria bacterium]|nr:sigma 54-interacting transcriptional regulator [Pseudomonadota bacterium]